MKPGIAAALALTAAAAAACSTGAAPSPGKVELVDAVASGPVAPLVTSEAARAVHDGKTLLVYVGATWCEPCRKFHEAAAAGALDAKLGDLRFLVFDLDRDDARLEAAGYTSEFVPLIARPGPDGRASGRQTDGVNSDLDTLTQLVPRIRDLAK